MILLKVGLRSHLVHSAFKKTPPKSLDLIRRCDALSCEGHCICAPQDQRCPDSLTIGVCNDVSDSKYANMQLKMIKRRVLRMHVLKIVLCPLPAKHSAHD